MPQIYLWWSVSGNTQRIYVYVYEVLHLKHASGFIRNEWAGGERCKGDGRGKGLLVRPPGRGMLSTLHPGKGSLRSSGPICSRRGKWHIIGSRPDKGFCVYYITRHQAHLSFITYIPPPHQEREKEGREKERERATSVLPRAVHAGCFYLQVRLSARRHAAFFLRLFSLPRRRAGNPLNITTPESTLEHPRRLCPQGFSGRY